MKELVRVRGFIRVEKRLLTALPGWRKHDAPTDVVTARNLIMDAGAKYYAIRGIGGIPQNSFRAFALFEGAGATAADDTLASCGPMVPGSLKRMASQYPVTDDQDPENQGDAGPNVITYQVTYGAAEANAENIAGVCITNYADGAPGSTEPLLMHARFPAISKNDSEELTITVNHVFGN